MGKHEVARPAVFLDRDGVINRVAVRNGMPHPPSYVEEFELYEDVADGCARLKAANFLLSKGFTDVANVEGGILAWAERIDKSLATY